MVYREILLIILPLIYIMNLYYQNDEYKRFTNSINSIRIDTNDKKFFM